MSPPLYVAIGLLATFAVLCIVAFIRYTADEALKILGVLTGFFGISFGAVCGYFFNHNEVIAAQQQATAYRVQLASVLKSTTEAKATLADTVDSKPATYT